MSLYFITSIFLRGNLAVSLVLLLGLRGAAACETEATQPMPPTRPQPAVIARVMGSAPDDSDSVMIVGDSIAMRWRPEVANDALGVKTFNFGLGSDQTSQVLWRLERAHFAHARFKRIILIVGSNNLRQQPCEIAAGILTVVDRLRKSFPDSKIDYVSILPRGRGLNFQEDRIVEVNQQIAAAIKEHGGHFIDAYTPFRKFCDHNDACSLYRIDHVHPSAEGYALLGQLLAH